MKITTPKRVEKVIRNRRSTEIDTIRKELYRVVSPTVEKELEYLMEKKSYSGTKLDHKVDTVYVNSEFKIDYSICGLFKDKETVIELMNKILSTYNWELETTHYMLVLDKLHWDMILRPTPPKERISIYKRFMKWLDV